MTALSKQLAVALALGAATILAGCASDQPASSTQAAAAKPEDANLALANLVKSALSADAELAALNLSVKADAKKGEVTLSGNVKSGAQLVKAALTTEKVAGVKHVLNDMHVR